MAHTYTVRYAYTQNKPSLARSMRVCVLFKLIIKEYVCEYRIGIMITKYKLEELETKSENEKNKNSKKKFFLCFISVSLMQNSNFAS